MMTLLEWAETYVKHRDLFEKRIASIEKDAEGLRIKNKDGSVTNCVVLDALDEKILKLLTHPKPLIVTKNLKENVTFLAKHWQQFAKNPGLKIIFVNLKHEEKWVLVPNSHHAIADPESLELGLQALHDAVPEG